MKLFVMIILLVHPVVADNHDHHGPHQHSDSGRRFYSIIVNGVAAKPKQFPFQAALMIHVGDQRPVCGGSLISNQWIVTAAHCTEDASGIDVYLGTIKPADVTVPSRLVIVVSREMIIIHEGRNRRKRLHDISLVRLPAPVVFSDYIKPVRLPKAGISSLYVGEIGITCGWGRTADARFETAEILQWIAVPVVHNAECEKSYKGVIQDTHICISTRSGRSACNGDSGGPLILERTGVLIGVTSMRSPKGCESNHPIVFTRISSYLSWIEKVTGGI